MKKLSSMIKNFRITRSVFSLPYVIFMMLFILAPLVLILVNAFLAEGKVTLDNFVNFFTNRAGLTVLLNSLLVGVITTGLCLLIGYPAAYLLSKQSSGRILVIFFMLPMWVNFLIRTLSTKAIFEAIGVELGWFTVIFGMVYNYLPFMILPLHTALAGIDKSYAEAAADLGANPVAVFVKTTLPMSVSGIISGITMVFVPTISTFAITEILSNRNIYLFGDSIQMKFLVSGDVGIGSVMSLIMLLFVLISNFILNRFHKKSETKGKNVW